ncbi:MAG: Uma2 family endonuclease [Candidatus Riflebacteria bacterium]|nr:Uma2 family endonuclease [Candidatus Riflebacteria bacterium]
MAGAVKKKKQGYSYADYLSWDDDKRYEIIDGEVFDMTSPSFTHQSIAGELFRQFADFFEDKPCKAIIAPFDVILLKGAKNDNEIYTVVQPDIMVVCDPKKIEERGIVGAPDLVIEIVSPSTASKDNIRKRALYEEAGVKEFWLVSPSERLVRVNKLGKNGRYAGEEIYDDTAQIEIAQFAGLSIDCRRVFPPLPKIRKVKAPPAKKYE